MTITIGGQPLDKQAKPMLPEARSLAGRAATAASAPIFAQAIPLADRCFATLADGMAATDMGGVFSTAESGILLAYLKSGPNHCLILPPDSREVLTEDRTYFVRDDGDDANDGLTGARFGAFRTVQRAIDAAYALDCNGFAVTIRLDDGVHDGPIRIHGPLTGAADGKNVPLRIIGNEASPAAVRLTVTGADLVRMGGKANALLAGVELRTVTAGDNINLHDFARLEHRNVIFGPCAREHINATSGAMCKATGPTTVTGDATCFCHPTAKALIDFSSQTVTFVGEPRFSIYLWGINDATVKLDGATIEGRAGSGQVFVHVNGVLNVSSCTGIWTGNSPPKVITGGIICAESQMLARTLYVSADGDDANDGFRPDSARAMRTIQGAIHRVAAYTAREVEDADDLGWRIQLSADTFAEDVVLRKLPCRTLVISGSGRLAAPHTVVRSFTNDIPGQLLIVQNLVLAGAASGGSALTANRGAIRVRKVRFDASGVAHMTAQNGGMIEVGAIYTISAELGAPPRYHMCATSGGLILNRSHAHEISDAVAFGNAFAFCDRLGMIRSDRTTFNGGTATGKRYDVRSNGVIDTGGGGAAHYPGDAPGTKASGGQYV